jgi:hypothetical protein
MDYIIEDIMEGFIMEYQVSLFEFLKMEENKGDITFPKAIGEKLTLAMSQAIINVHMEGKTKHETEENT